jgi:glycosyltransferase involved in cell wall biosynthesis
LKANEPLAGLTSIIIPCWNQLEFTRHRIAALKRHTRPPWELIVVDNGSTDGTALYLAGVQDAAAVPVTVIANPTNRGFPAAINQELKVARGEYLVLLNNDAVVTDAWFDQLIALATAKLGTEDDLTAKNSKVSKEEREEREATARLGTEDDLTARNSKDAKEEREEREGREKREESEIDREPGNGAGGSTTVDLALGGGTQPADTEDTTGRGASPPLAAGPRPAPASKSIGLVGPMSNYATPPQLVEGVPYRDLSAMHVFARRWRDQHRGKWFAVRKLSGFCLLMKRAVYDAIGGLDERFGLGMFDDDDLAERARRAGFELAVAHDLFIHHFGSRTFQGNGIDAEKLLDENARRFAAKWGRAAANGKRVALQPWAEWPAFFADSQREFARQVDEPVSAGENGPSHSNGAVPTARTGTGRRAVKVSLTMIVRDEEVNLPHCLGSVRGLFDEIVVVDTGSVDRTREIARDFGAKVFDFAWIDDFAAARNEALAHATGDYAFWLDADDVVEPAEREKLVRLLQKLTRGDEAAYVVRCACDPGADGVTGATMVDHVRLFPLRRNVRWSYRVHEQILPALNRARFPVRWTDLVVRHTGSTEPGLRARKLDRDVRILERELSERPDDPFVLFNLGSIALDRRQWHEGLGFLERSLAGSAPSDSIVRKLFALIARAHQMMGNSQQALDTCARGLKLDPEDAELWFRKGQVHRRRGELAEAEACLRRILGLKRPEQFCSFNQGIYGHVTRRNLAEVAAERGDHAEAARLWGEVLAECPGDRQALANLEKLNRSSQGETP